MTSGAANLSVARDIFAMWLGPLMNWAHSSMPNALLGIRLGTHELRLRTKLGDHEVVASLERDTYRQETREKIWQRK
jgi:hypothetical protein